MYITPIRHARSEWVGCYVKLTQVKIQEDK
jgi:hypothetical protein